MEKAKIKMLAFWPAFILLIGAIILNIVNEEAFTAVFNTLNNLFMTKLGWLAALAAIVCVVLCIAVMCSKFGKVKIGGRDAKPKMSNFSWFSLMLTSSLASGILVWGAAEPIYHIQDPASAITGIEPNSGEAAKFAMETMYMHWSFIPYAIMATGAIVFAFVFYNAKKRYSVSSQIDPALGKANTNTVSSIVDSLVLFCITTAIAASMGQMLLNINSGLGHIFGIEVNNTTLVLICVVFAVIYIGTAITGLDKGMKWCADVNVYLYIALLVAFLILGPTAYFLNLGTESLGGFLTSLFDHSLMTGAANDSNWPQSWTTFYWASYFAWTPTLGLFFATISYGRTIRAMTALIFGLGGGFGLIWMTLISGTAIERQMSGTVDLVGALATEGTGGIPYLVLNSLPLGKVLGVLYLVIMVFTFVTAANANISVMAGLSVEGQGQDTKPSKPLLLIWGVIVAVISCFIVAWIGIDGVKALSNIGGIVALFIEIGIAASIVVCIAKWRKIDQTGTYLKEEREFE